MFKITINAKDLGVIQTLDKIASCSLNKTLTAQASLLLEVDDNQTMRLTASNAEARITATQHPTQVDGNGKICIDPKKLGALVRAIGEMPMTIAYDDTNMVEITTPNGKYGLNTYDAAIYPQAVNAAGTTYKVLTEDIARGIKATAFAAATEADYHAQLQGVQIAFGDSSLTFTATNTRLLAQLSITDFPSIKTAAVVIPTKYAQMMADICDCENGEASITIAEKSLTLKTATVEFTSALIAGNYPDANRVFPNETKIEARVDAATLRTTLSRVAILANDRIPSIHLSVDTDGQIHVSTEDKDTSQDASELIYGTANHELDIDFAYKNLACALSAFTDIIVMRAIDAAHPMLLVPAEKADNTIYRVLVMPMRIQ